MANDLQLIDDLCDICVQLAGIVRRQSEMLAQVGAVEDAMGAETMTRLEKILEV